MRCAREPRCPASASGACPHPTAVTGKHFACAAHLASYRASHWQPGDLGPQWKILPSQRAIRNSNARCFSRYPPLHTFRRLHGPITTATMPKATATPNHRPCPTPPDLLSRCHVTEHSTKMPQVKPTYSCLTKTIKIGRPVVPQTGPMARISTC